MGCLFGGSPYSSFGRIQVFNDWFSVQVGGPVDQVKAPKQHREHDAGDAVDLTDAVEGLLALLGLGLCCALVGVAQSALRDGGQCGVFCDVGSVVSHSYSVGIVLLHDGRFLFLQGKWLRVSELSYLILLLCHTQLTTQHIVNPFMTEEWSL